MPRAPLFCTPAEPVLSILPNQLTLRGETVSDGLRWVKLALLAKRLPIRPAVLYPGQDREIITTGDGAGKIRRLPIPCLTCLASCQPTCPCGTHPARPKKPNMPSRKALLSAVALLLAIGFRPASGEETAAIAAAPAVAAPTAELLGISIAEGPARLVDIDGLRQLIVDGTYADGRTRDLTGQVQYQADPPGIVAIDSTGVVTPLADGSTTVTAMAAGGQKAQTALTVVGRSVAPTISFDHQVVPVFTKAGCNAGSCHGKLSGQNGFRLSLLGFYPHDDYNYLVKEDRGRRLFPAAPANSLLLKKGTAAIPHRGGMRIQPGSLEFELVARWISQGMPATPADCAARRADRGGAPRADARSARSAAIGRHGLSERWHDQGRHAT